MATNMGRVKPPDPNAGADHGMGAPNTAKVRADIQSINDNLQKLRYDGGAYRAAAQKSAHNHR